VGPQRMVIAGGIILAGATLLSAYLITPVGMTILWGGLWGLGLACSFAAVTPAAIKWFYPSRKGLVTGIVVFGMGISAFIMAPLVNYSIANLGLQATLQIIGIILLFGVLISSFFVENPPEELSRQNSTVKKGTGFAPAQIFRCPQFYLLWLIFCFISGTGVTFVSHLDTISRVQFSFGQGFLMVSLFSFFNAWGRIVAGVLSDWLGRSKAMTFIFSALTLTLAGIIFFRTPTLLALAVSIVGLSYGGLFTLFPATVSTFFGEKDFGFFYGLIFSGMMVGGLFPLITSYLFEVRGDFTAAFILLLIFCFAAVLLSLLVKKPPEREIGSRV